MIYIFAGTFQQAKEYAYEEGLEPHDWQFIESPRALLGTQNPEIVKTGTWWDRRDREEILNTITMVTRRTSP